MSDDLTPVSVERDGRVLSGVGASVADLEATMDRHTPEPVAKPDATIAAPVAEPSQKQTRGAKRFSELTAEREDAKRERDAERQRADAAARERDDLRAQLAQRPAEPARPAPSPAGPVAASAPVAPLTRPKPTEAEVGVGAKYETYADFVEDLSDWKAEQRIAQLDVNAQIRTFMESDRSQQAFVNTFTAMHEQARQTYPDFDQALATGPGADVHLAVTASGEPDTARANARTQAIVQSPYAGQLLYTIAKDAALANALAKLSDIDFGVALARLAQQDAPVASVPASTGPRPLTAPAPYVPVGGRSQTTAVSSSDLPKKGFDFDKSGYREKRAAERGIKLAR